MRSVNTAECRFRLVAVILFVALNGSPACTLDTAGLLHEGPDVPDHGADADGGVDLRDDGVDRPDVTDLPDTTAEDAEPSDDGGEEAIEDDAGDVTEHDAGEDDAAEDMEIVDEYLDDAEDEADAAEPDDGTAADDAAPETILCDPAGSDDYCLGTILRQCNATGTGWAETPCSLNCASGPARCLGVIPTNVSDRSLMRAGPGVLAPAPAVQWIRFSTGTGRIEAWDASRNPLPDIRPPGAGLHAASGIHFATQAQPDGAPTLGIWSVAGFSLPSTVAMAWAEGPNAMVILSSGPVAIEGILTVGASVTTADLPGPAGGAGGGARTRGGGAGGGAGGSDGSGFRDMGGGGAGFGGGGGAGGTISGSAGGAGGAIYPGPTLSPLRGGSGGGGGGDGDGGRGGHGAGALQIVSGESIRIVAPGGIDAGGGGGRGGGPRGAGGGGGSGGSILLEAPRIDVGGGIAANGGGGGAGARSTSVGGANGQNGDLATTAAPGGAWNGSGTGGGAGSSADAPAGGAGGSSDSHDDSGGGGGGAGRIRLNKLTGSVAGFLSPSLATGAATEGTITLD